VSCSVIAGEDWLVFSFLVVGLALLSVAATVVIPVQPPEHEVDALGLALVAIASLSLLLARTTGRRASLIRTVPEPAGQRMDEPARGRWPAGSGPLAALAVTGTIVVLNAMAGYGIGFIQWPPWIAVFCCFAAAGLPVRAVATTLAVLAVLGYLAFDSGPVDALTVTGIAMCFLLAAIAGDAVRVRRAHAVTLQAELLGRGREQALAAEHVLLTERSRLARELHDSLGHSVNVMVLQAGVGRRVFAENPDFAQQALTSVESVGRGALVELDRMLRVLHPLGPGRDEEPLAPTLADVATVVDRIRATGREVELRTDPAEGLRLTAGAARALYRIVQEGLTNAVRHGSAGRISVEITHRVGEVVVEVGNPVASPAPADRTADRPIAGRGLINMQERARLEGGDFEAGPVPGGFRVRATLPMDAVEVDA
jgi:signal transduction histidine kinase